MSERMSSSEAIMWAVEKDPSLRSDFCAISILDRTPDPLAVRAKLAGALDGFPRLREHAVSAPLRVAPPEWRTDPSFDLDYHIRRVALPAPGTLRSLFDLVATLCAPPLDRSRPLWELIIVEGLDDDRAALVQRMHHTVTDGEGALRLSLSLVDLERDPDRSDTDLLRAAIDEVGTEAPTGATVEPHSPFDVVRSAFGFAINRNLELLGRGLRAGGDLVLHPQRAPQHAFDALRTAGSARRQLLVTDAGHSALLATRSLARRFDTMTLPLADLKAAGRALGGTVNDAYVTGIVGGLGLYHDRMGVPVDDLRMAMAVSTRAAGDATSANQFVPTRVVVPVGPKEPTVRFALVQDRLQALRREPALDAADGIAALAVGVPTSVLVQMMRSQARTVDFATSNLRGSPVDLYIGGARVEASYPMGPRSGCAVNFTALSYCGSLDVGIHSDPASVTDPGALVDCVEESFAELLAARHRRGLRDGAAPGPPA